MEVISFLGWFILSIFVAIALHFFVIPKIKYFVTLRYLAYKVKQISKNIKNIEEKKKLEEIAKQMNELSIHQNNE